MRQPSKTRKNKRSAVARNQDWSLGLAVVNSKAAGIDIGNEEHFVAVPPSMDPQPVRMFGCYTSELKRMATWLRSLGITTVAMQSTGVYWIAVADTLREQGMRVTVANGRDTKNLPGRKTDIQECQWLLKLHVYGLLKDSFVPDEQLLAMRRYWRQRQQHIADASTAVQRMQKTLTQMNVQLRNAISDITGTTGISIIEAILSGERDPEKLAQFRDPRVKKSKRELAQALEGNWREELLFILQQEYETYCMYQGKAAECDAALERHLARLQQRADPAELPPCPRHKKPRSGDNVPSNFDLREELFRVSGADLTQIDGINVLTAQTILAEVGWDVSYWPTEGQFVSWLGLAPNHKISGGKIIGRDYRKVVSGAGQALRMCATTLLRSKTYLGAQYRRLRTKLGAPKAIKAMAARLARIVYRMLKFGLDYVDKGAHYYEQKYREQQIRQITKQARKLGLHIVDPKAA